MARNLRLRRALAALGSQAALRQDLAPLLLQVMPAGSLHLLCWKTHLHVEVSLKKVCSLTGTQVTQESLLSAVSMRSMSMS